jgi:hypothetical protein
MITFFCLMTMKILLSKEQQPSMNSQRHRSSQYTLPGIALPDFSDEWGQSEVGLSGLPPLSERMGLKDKNATDSTNSISLADDTFELERPAPVHDRKL